MVETFRFEPSPAALDVLMFTRAAESAIGRALPSQVAVAHGANSARATISRSDSDGRVLPVSERLATKLGLMPGVPYRLAYSGGTLNIGPVVGILVTARADRIDLTPGSFAACYALRYAEVGGLVCFFASDGVDVAAKTIRGYYWLPDGPKPEAAGTSYWAQDSGQRLTRARSLASTNRKRAAAEGRLPRVHPRTARFAAMASQFRSATHTLDHAGRWSDPTGLGEGHFEAGIFPFPAAVWLRVDTVPEPVLTGLREGAGGRIFNSDLFDKAEGYRRLSADALVAPHLPRTVRFEGPEQLREWLAHESRAVLKRTGGQAGAGLMVITRGSGSYSLQTSTGEPRAVFPDFDGLFRRLTTLATESPYLIQQWVDLPEYAGRLCDYRVMMQKDDCGKWRLRACLGRFGAKGAVVTNFINNGYALPANEAIGRSLRCDRSEACRLEGELVDLAYLVCAAVDRSGGIFGDLGLDIAIDRDRRLWLFEVNKLPMLELPLYMGDEQLWLDAKSGPLLYAAYLAGFPRDG